MRSPVDERPLAVGDRVVVAGGYSQEPDWMAASPSGYEGRVTRFIPGQSSQPAAVIELDTELVLPHGAGATRGEESRGRFLILELGHVGATWITPTPRVHVELCESEPASRRWQDRPQGAWVESHATYRRKDVIPR